MGNKSIAADPRRCVSCKSCMAACTAKHSVECDVALPRLKVVQVNRTNTAPILCRHCTDAPCAAACPAGALFQDEVNARVGVDMSRCIGCRNCVSACPYGAVDVAFCGATGHSSRAVVIKCDRCVDREGGPACAEACGFNVLRVVERDSEGFIVRICDEEACDLQHPALRYETAKG